MMTRLLLVAAFLLLIGMPASLRAQLREKGGPSLLGSNAEGTHFMVGFMQNETDVCMKRSIYRVISIASRFQTEVTIRFPDRTVVKKTVPAFQVFEQAVPEYFECIGEGVFDLGIEITSTEPISVYCYNSRYLTSDGYMALPISSWGTQYVSANYYLDHYTPDDSTDDYYQYLCDKAPRGGEFAVIAAEETVVSVYPKTKTVTAQAAGVMFQRVLQKGDILQVQDGGTVRGGTDLTGSVIIANKPVGVLSGHIRAGIPTQFDTKDHLIEMLPPREMLSTEHILVPFGGRNGGDVVRVIASEPGTTNVSVTVEGVEVTTFALSGMGEWGEYELERATVITSDKPILVTQYSKSSGADPENVNRPPNTPLPHPFDPDMMVITPTDQYVNAAVFQTLPNRSSSDIRVANQFDYHYLTIVAEQESFGTIQLDNGRLADHPGFVTGNVIGAARPYLWATVRVSDGQTHVLTSDGLFSGFIYGLGEYDSYAWPIGSGMRRLGQIDTKSPSFATQQKCDQFTVRVADSGITESGLQKVWLVDSASSNVRFQGSLLIHGDDFNNSTVTTIDPTLPGKAQMVAMDLQGNLDTFNLILPALAPTFSSDSLLFADVPPGILHTRSFTLTNSTGNPMRIDSVGLVVNREFILASGYQGAVLQADQSLPITVTFKSDEVQDFADTVLVGANCRVFRLPVAAQMPLPQISTEDLEYYGVRAGRAKTMRLRVWNPGVSTLKIDSVVMSPGVFSNMTGKNTPFLLDAGKDSSFQIRFIPPSTGDFTGAVTFHSTAGIAIARLHGVGLYPKLEIGGWDFGKIQVGDTGMARLPIVNSGTDTAFVTGITIAEAAIFPAPAASFRDTLLVGDTTWVDVAFVPQAQADYRSAVFLNNDDGLEATNTLLGSGYILAATIDGYDWKERWVGSVHDTLVLLRNTAREPVTISRIWIDAGDTGDFEAEPLLVPLTLDSGETAPVAVRFSPLMAGHREAVIAAQTDSRQTPIITNTLQGFGLIALASDQLEWDSSESYSCDTRTGWLTIHNDGNTPLTIADIQLSSQPSIATAMLPAAGTIIPVGGDITVAFSVPFDGLADTVTGQLTWSYQEIPGTFARQFGVRSRPQRMAIRPIPPAVVPNGSNFSIIVAVDSLYWEKLPISQATVTVAYNPRMAMFNRASWDALLADGAKPLDADWVPAGVPTVDTSGLLTLRLKPRNGATAYLDGAVMLPIPFHIFIAEDMADTFTVTMTAGPSACASPAVTTIPYRVDSICGLSHRLFYFTGNPYALKQSIPNPATHTAQIEFTLAMDSETKLEIFAADGRPAIVPIDGYLRAGDYRLTVDASGLSSGTYFYRLTSGEFSSVRQMVIRR
ncbi:MAG: T9SS C-terminal target domain-containing protein [Chlorobi bacterium CHB2]|nr:T9SS C-terminal target domain-containing protein [Chlorobi bacterium CHB2]